MRLSGIIKKKRLLIALFTVSTGLVGALAAAAPSQAGPAAPAAAPVPLAASAAPQLPTGASRLGALTAGTTMHVDVTLNVPDQAALTAFLSGVTDPASPYYHKFLGAGEFGPRFGPSLAQVAAVENALKAAARVPGPVTSDRLDIPVTATASAIERGFGVTLDNYRMPGGRVAYATTAAPKLSATIAPLVQGVVGLDDLYPMEPPGGSPAKVAPAAVRSVAQVTHAASAAVGPQPCSTAVGNGNTANTIAGYYGTNLLYQLGDLGQGQRIGVVEFEPNSTNDINFYKTCYGVNTTVNYIKVGKGAGSGSGGGEAALDIEMLIGLAPRATIDVYQAPNTQAAGLAIFRDFTNLSNRHVEKTLSTSWASCEAGTSLAVMNAYETQAEKAAAQGQTILAAAGDTGSSGCYRATGSKAPSAQSPSILPYVVGVGGTSFNNNGAEIVWNDSDSGNGAGGGGVSTHFCMPAYQHRTSIPGIVNGLSKKDTSASCKTKFYREGPDISADGDPIFGYAIYYAGSWQPIGGTSASTPLWAAIAALTNASPFCSDEDSGSPGVLPQVLYKVAATYHSYLYAPKPQGLRDIRIGNNDYTPTGYTGGRYPATKGFDMATGLGAPMVGGVTANGQNWITFIPGYAALACHAQARKLISPKVISVSPRSGKAGTTKLVTVHGSGFLPIPGADQARIISGGKVIATVTANCSKGACTLTLPAESARTVDIKIYAQALWSSPLSKGDRYTYNKA